MAEFLSEHPIDIQWQRDGEFSHEGFERRHQLSFNEGVTLTAGGAGNTFGSDPEQLLAAAMASCHMQTFLVLASKKRLQVASYEDKAVAELVKGDDGLMRISTIRMTPKAVFEGDKQPDEEAIRKMHDKAHHHCFIANSVSCHVEVEPQF